MINYVEFKAGNKEYKLALNTRSIVSLEKQLGHNPMMIFSNDEEIPPVTTMVAILYASMQMYHHKITLDNAYDIFDKYLADGNSVTDFIYVIVEIFKVSGLIRIGDEGDEEAKN